MRSPHGVKAHWATVADQLASGHYRPAPVKRVEINKPDGGIRLLGIPTVTDRVIQQAIAQAITPIFAPDFSEHSFTFARYADDFTILVKSKRYQH